MQNYNNLLTIIIPVYNEEKSLITYLPEVITFCKENSFKLIIINDGSKDNTSAILTKHLDDSVMKIVNHKVNRGYGGALKSGIRNVDTKYLITIDGDGQHVLNDVKKLLDEIISKDADMIIGSREGLKSAGIYRKLGKSVIRFFAKLMMPIKIYDINSGMKIYNSDLAKKYIKLCPDNMAYSDIIGLIFISQRHLVLELPISINPRTEGQSTINTMTALDTLKEILNIVVLFNPLKVFMPISLLCIIAGLAWGIPIMLIHGRGLSVGALMALVTGLIFFFFGFIAEQLSLLRKSRMND
jgi:glycosyltransferase involved in cell wall biosynthesis